MQTKFSILLALAVTAALTSLPLAGAEQGTPTSPETQRLNVRLSWGHQSALARPYHIELLTNGVVAGGINAEDFEAGATVHGAVCETRAGAGHVDAINFAVSWRKPSQAPRQPQSIWQHLLNHGEPGQVARLKDDPSLQPDAPVLTVLTAADGTRGILHRSRTTRPTQSDVAAGARCIRHAGRCAGGFRGASRLAERRTGAGSREARTGGDTRGVGQQWEDIGNPTNGPSPGQRRLAGHERPPYRFVARHGSLYKFGVDRWASVRPDLCFAA